MPIMSEEWIFRCWDYRDDAAVSANDEHLVMTNMPSCLQFLPA